MVYDNIVEALENKNLVEAHELLEKSLYHKVGVILEEKKKQVVAKTFTDKHLSEEDEATIFKASRRKAFKEQMHTLKLNKDQHPEKKV